MTRSIHRFLVALVLSPVVLYRRYLSPLKRRPSCIYLPTCSQYALEAVKTRGIVVGIALALVRILRCNPLFHGGYDPVPSSGAARCAHAHHAPGSPRAALVGAPDQEPH